MNLAKNIKVISLKDAVTAGTSVITDATVVDTQGYEGCLFIAKFGTSAVDNGIKVLQDTVVGFGTGADLAGSKQLLDATAKVAMVDIHRPLERFLKPSVLRGTSTTLDSLIAVLYSGRVKPITDDASVNSKIVVSPSEGTA
jgi:hypothetical protein